MHFEERAVYEPKPVVFFTSFVSKHVPEIEENEDLNVKELYKTFKMRKIQM